MLQVRYRLPPGLTWETLLDRLAALDWRAAIVGPHGRGKTTLLEDLAPRLAERGFTPRTITLRQDQPRLGTEARAVLRSLGPRDILLLDGAELLGRTAWLGVRLRCNRAAGLVITSHRPGLLPTLLDCETTPELLAGLVEELLRGRRDAVPEDLAERFQRHGGNLRDALRGLYDRWAVSPPYPPRDGGSSR